MSISFNLFVSDKIRQLSEGNIKQLQANISQENVVELLTLAGLPTDTVLSRKRDVMLDITVKTPKGTEVTLRQGDTHAVWYGHQTDENAKKILEYAAEKGAVSFPVEYVKVVENDKPKSIACLEDCPV